MFLLFLLVSVLLVYLEKCWNSSVLFFLFVFVWLVGFRLWCSSVIRLVVLMMNVGVVSNSFWSVFLVVFSSRLSVSIGWFFLFRGEVVRCVFLCVKCLV